MQYLFINVVLMYSFCVVIVYSMISFVFCFNVLFVYLVVYVICIVLTLPPGGQPICSTTMMII
jgi:hypothetical protein